MNHIKRDWIPKSLFVFCAIIAIVFLYKMCSGSRLNNNASHQPVKAYLEISKNARERGPLIIGNNGRYGIYAISHNDPAFPVLISVLSLFGVEFHNPLDIQFMNLFLLWFSLLCFLLIFLGKRPRVFGAVWFLILVYYYQTGFKHSMSHADQHSTVPALTVFTFLLVEIFFKKGTVKGHPFEKFLLSRCSVSTHIVPVLFLAVLGGFFGMFRNYFTSVFVLLLTFYWGLANLPAMWPARPLSPKKRLLSFVVFLVAVLICLNFSAVVQRGFYHYSRIKNPDLPLTTSDLLDSVRGKPDLPVPSYLLQPPYGHGIWHNAYIGLGYFKNEWGIRWDDTVGFEHARRYDPAVIYPNPEYYTVMRKLYFKYLREEPVECIKNHLKKMFKVWTGIVDKNLTLILIFLLIFSYRISGEYRKLFVKKISLNPVGYFSLLFVVPVVTFYSFHIGLIVAMFLAGFCFSQVTGRVFLNPIHAVPFFLFFMVPVVTIPLFSYAVVTYVSLVIIKLISKQLELSLRGNP